MQMPLCNHCLKLQRIQILSISLRMTCFMLSMPTQLLKRILIQVVPDVLKNKILELGHGKLGQRRPETHSVKKGIGRDMRYFCKKCVAFNNHRRDVQPQQPIPVITEPRKKLAMDIVGPLTRTTTGYHYILTVIDTATLSSCHTT